MKISFREIANRITGFEVPIFGGGLSWNPPQLDIEVARQILTFLEDRRALYNPYSLETPDYVVRSIDVIRQEMTDYLKKLEPKSKLTPILKSMRAACRKFMDKSDNRSHFF